MVSNRLLLGVVAFGVSFGIGFLSHRNANRALLTSLITLPATYAAAIVVDKRRKNRELLVLTSQRHQIQQLEAEEINLNRILSQANAKKQELEVSVHYLLSEHHRLHNQTEIERNYKLDLQREIASLNTQRQEIEKSLERLHVNISELGQHKQALSQFISHTLAEKEALEQIVLNLQSEAMQLNARLSDKIDQEKALYQQIQSNQAIIEQQRSQQHELQAELNNLQFNHAHINTIHQTEQAIEALKAEKQQLELKTSTQQNQLENLEQRQAEIENSLTAIKRECEATKSNLRSLHIKKEQQQDELLALQAERNQLQSQILEFQNQIEALITPPTTEDQPEDSNLFPFAELIDSLDSSSEDEHHLASEWLNFMKHLPDDDIKILNAILTQNNPNKIIKKVAESKITMPALLLDKINQYALETIGDSIIDMNSEPIQIIEDYQDAVSKLIQVYENTVSNSCN